MRESSTRTKIVAMFALLAAANLVVLLCLALALSAAYVQTHPPQWKSVGTLVGTYELLQILQDQDKVSLRGRFWDDIRHMNLDKRGFVIASAFVLSWSLSRRLYRTQRSAEAA